MKHLQQYVQAQIIAHGKPVRYPNRQLTIGKGNLKSCYKIILPKTKKKKKG
mgnify:FL=1